MWAERYDRSLADVFAVQDEITQAVVAAIKPQLIAAESFRAQRKAPDSMDAWELVMRALSHYWRVTRQDNVVAQGLLQKAIAIDPNYGRALGVLAASHIFSAHMGWADMATALTTAEHAALAAIRADSEDPWAHYALASTYLFTRRFDNLLAEFELALQLNPSFAPALGYYGVALAYCGRWEEGDLAARRALRLSPRDPFAAIYCGVAAYAQFVGHNYSEAIRLSREGLRQRSDFVGAHRVLTAAAAMAGMDALAKDALQELRRARRTSRWPGWRTRCRSSATSTASTIWTASGGPAWSSRRAVGLSRRRRPARQLGLLQDDVFELLRQRNLARAEGDAAERTGPLAGRGWSGSSPASCRPARSANLANKQFDRIAANSKAHQPMPVCRALRPAHAPLGE